MAVADLDRTRRDDTAQKRQCRAAADFRELLDAKDIDAVCDRQRPDHWHVAPALLACQTGKDVYLEETAEPHDLRRAMSRQRGSQAQAGFADGQPATVHETAPPWAAKWCATDWSARSRPCLIMNYPSPWECGLPGQPVRDGLDWDAWCGPTEPRALPRRHLHSAIQPGLDQFPALVGRRDDRHRGPRLRPDPVGSRDGPTRGPLKSGVKRTTSRLPSTASPRTRTRGNRLCSEGYRVRMRYANGIVIRLEPGESAAGASFVGPGGKIRIGNNTVDSNPPELVTEAAKDLKVRLPEIDHHIQNWFDCIKSRERPIADVEIGHRSAILCHLGNIARWAGRRLGVGSRKRGLSGRCGGEPVSGSVRGGRDLSCRRCRGEKVGGCDQESVAVFASNRSNLFPGDRAHGP